MTERRVHVHDLKERKNGERQGGEKRETEIRNDKYINLFSTIGL